VRVAILEKLEEKGLGHVAQRFYSDFAPFEDAVYQPDRSVLLHSSLPVALLGMGAMAMTSFMTHWIIVLPIVIASLTIHEFAHALMAYMEGDNTAYVQGRLTLNPFAHISVIGTIIMPLLCGFGWAKPVPIDLSKMSSQGVVNTSLAGPMSNVMLALILTVAFNIITPVPNSMLGLYLVLGIYFNVLFAVFNLLPLPPLDGSKILVFISTDDPNEAYQRLERFGTGILIVGLVTGLIGLIVFPFIKFYFVLAGLPYIFGGCGPMYWRELLARLRAKEVQDEKDAERVADEIEDSVEDMGEKLDELAEEIIEEDERLSESGDEDGLESEVSEAQAHDIKAVTIRALTEYIKSSCKNRDFEKAALLVAGALQKQVLKQDTADVVKKFMERGEIRDKLRLVYDKTAAEIDEHEPEGKDVGPSGGATQAQQNWLRQKLDAVSNHLGHGPHGHPHVHMLIAGVLVSLYLIGKYAFGWDIGQLGLVMSLILATRDVSGKAPEPDVDDAAGGADGATDGADGGVPDYVAKYTNDLDELASRRALDDTYYMSDKVSQLNNGLLNVDANNSMLIGDPVACQGLIEACVVRKAEFSNLRRARFFELNGGRFADSLAIPAVLEKELKKLSEGLEAVAGTKGVSRVILVINFQDIYAMTRMKGGMTATISNQLKQVLESENVSVIIAADPILYKEKLAREKRLEARFQVIDLRAPPEYALLDIARNFKRKISTAYAGLIPAGIDVTIKRDTIKGALRLSGKYYTDGLSVNKLQEILDRIITETFTFAGTGGAYLRDIRGRILKTGSRLAAAVRDGGQEEEVEFLENTLDRLLAEEEGASARLKAHEEFMKAITETGKWEITVKDIANKISEERGIPVYEMLATEDDLLKGYEGARGGMLIGQDRVVSDSYAAFCRRREFGGTKQPIGIFLLVGPTGVGKTEFARSVARYMFGSEDAMARVDMTEFMNDFDREKLIGPPPGYIGYEEGGVLTDRVRRQPYTLVLLDEIEKANGNVRELFLQVFQEGELRDGKGRVARFDNTIIVMTSNLGFSEICEAEKAEAQAIDELVKALKQDVTDFKESKSDSELKADLGNLKKRLEAIQAKLSADGMMDVSLSEDIDAIGRLLGRETQFTDDQQTRVTFLQKFYKNVGECFEKYKVLNIENVYKIIALFKDVTIEGGDMAAGVAKEVDGILGHKKEYLKLKMITLASPNAPEYQALYAEYKELCGLMAEQDINVKIRGMLKYLRRGVRDKIIKTIRAVFTPEQVNRIGVDNIISFDPLSMGDLSRILDIKVEAVTRLLEAQGYGKLSMSEELRSKVLDEGYDVANGARPLERSLKRTILGPLSVEILSGRLEKGKDVEAYEDGGDVRFRSKERVEGDRAVRYKDRIDA
ncbi:MAG: AAA family ATPase, partial [Candidatus Omnitrophota bacterium]